jgi:hypothetical protein
MKVAENIARVLATMQIFCLDNECNISQIVYSGICLQLQLLFNV